MTKLSECAGRYELGDPVCDGQAKQKACGWKSGCKALKKYCNVNNIDIDDVTVNMTLEEIEELIIPYMLKPKLKKKWKRIGRVDYPDEIWHLYEHFERLFSKTFPKRVVNLLTSEKKRQIVLQEGRFFSVDQLRNSNYVTWYCKGKTRDIAIVSLHFKQNIGKLAVELPVSRTVVKNTLIARDFNKLDIRIFNEGQFKSKILRCDYEEIGIVVSLLRKLVDNGDIEIPEYKKFYKLW